jgi:hypothetical protein
MDDVAKHLKGWQTEGKLQHDCEVLVLYQDRTAEQVAGLLCSHLEREVEPELDLTFTWISLPRLDHPHVMQGAIHAAESADLLILSLHNEAPGTVDKLVRTCQEHRIKSPGAIIGLIGGQSEASRRQSPVHQKLETLANEIGFQYWAPLSWSTPGEIPASLDSFLERARQVTPLLEEILKH